MMGLPAMSWIRRAMEARGGQNRTRSRPARICSATRLESPKGGFSCKEGIFCNYSVMSEFKIRIGNYRNVPYSHPLELEVERNITFIVGVNNVGKTNLLRLFHELRPVFSELSLEQFQKNESWEQQ